MADAYGGISLSTSKDSKFNADLLVELLNKLNWANTYGVWEEYENKGRHTFWYHDNFNTQYPTVFPEKGTDTSIERTPSDQATDENCSNIETDYISLAELSEMFSESIKSGWFEIACTANEKNRYVYFQSLRIYAGGKAVRKQICSGVILNEPIDETEVYDPLNDL